ncbi:hypothetical protein JG688_00012466, partial [Phytophthora aleatoria]
CQFGHSKRFLNFVSWYIRIYQWPSCKIVFVDGVVSHAMSCGMHNWMTNRCCLNTRLSLLTSTGWWTPVENLMRTTLKCHIDCFIIVSANISFLRLMELALLQCSVDIFLKDVELFEFGAWSTTVRHTTMMNISRKAKARVMTML